jgi:hypothetical protein
MPEWMFSDLTQRADRRHITVPELIRRAVSLDKTLYDLGEPLFIGEGKNRQRILLPDWEEERAAAGR